MMMRPSHTKHTHTRKTRMRLVFLFICACAIFRCFDAFKISLTRSTVNEIKRHKKLSMSSEIDNPPMVEPLLSLATPLLLCTFAEPVQAAVFAVSDAVPSALTAYGHYLGLVLVTVSLTAERLLIKPKMSVETEKLVGLADILYGVAGTLVVVTGYFRATAYGKGWDFYSHEPIFWLKLLLFAVMGASSFMPTTKIVQRAIAINNAENGKGEFPEPMSEKLANRLTKIVNGELLAVASIPLAASLMSRGVGYAEWLPWQAVASVVALAFGGLSFKYVKEALDWKEE